MPKDGWTVRVFDSKSTGMQTSLNVLEFYVPPLHNTSFFLDPMFNYLSNSISIFSWLFKCLL